MNNSNSFNICPRCGTANGLNAKYCYQCGSQLKVPEEPVVCPKCHTVNSSMANFCRTCGGTLKVGAQTKICPKCGREVNIEENVCSCGYSFATVRTAAPAAQTGASEHNGKKKRAEKEVVPLQRKGGRLVAVFSLIFLLLFAYAVIAPQNLKPEFMRGIGVAQSGADKSFGYDIVSSAVTKLMAGGIAEFDVAVWIITVLTSLFAICVVVHLVACIVRFCTGKKDKRANILYLVLAIVSSIAVALTVSGMYFPDNNILKVFASAQIAPDYMLYVVPGYFWFFYIFSLFAKARKLKELKL